MKIRISKSHLVKYGLMILLTIPSFIFWQYALIPQYGVRDHEGYLGGALVLSGYISFIVLMNLLKEIMLNGEPSELSIAYKIFNKDNVYILGIVNVLMSLICIRTLLFYHSRVYLFSLAAFWAVPFAYVIIRQIHASHNISSRVTTRRIAVHHNFYFALSVGGVIAIISTMVRGLYIFRWQVMLTLVLLILLGMLSFVGCSSYYPYDLDNWIEETREQFKGKIKLAFIIVLSLVVLYMFLGPLEIYVGNMLSFSFGYKTFLPLCIICGVSCVVLLTAFISLFSHKTYKVLCVFLTAFSLLSYIQCIIMNTKLSEEDGARLRLDTMGNYPEINLVIWIVLAIVIFTVFKLSKNKWKNVAAIICSFISSIQMVAVISLIITCMTSPEPRFYQLTGEKMFTVAKNENVIVLVPDSFCRKYFDELVDDNPECVNLFRDFTYYNNMDSRYHPTFPSFTHFITGYDNVPENAPTQSSGRVEWLNEAWNSEKCNLFFKEIKNQGYKFYINIPSACELLGAYNDVCDKVENAEYAESNVDKVELVKMLFSMSVYRCVPYIFKPPFEFFSWDFAELERYNGKTAAYKNEDFYSEVCKGITIDDSIDKKISVINWHGFHEEYTNDEYCNYVPNAESEGVTRLQNGKGVLLCIDKYLEDLKDIGMYDKSTIIVMGDHGKLYDGCVFIKLPNEAHNEMQINNKPGVYDDFQATILDMIRAQNCDSFGNSWLE